MIARSDAQILLEGLNYLIENPNVQSWKGTSRISFLGSLSEIFLTDDIGQIRKDLEIISSGQISPNTTPQDVLERATNQNITKEDLEVRVQEQRSQVRYWVSKLKERVAEQKTIENQVTTGATEKETISQKQTKTAEKVKTQQKPKEVLIKEKLSSKEAVIPVTVKEEIKKEIPVGEKLENVQIKFDVKETGSVEERLNATQPFLAASLKTQQSEFIDLNPSLNLISKGISSKNLEQASKSLPEGPEKESLLRISYTMKEIEKIFPDEISRFKNYISIENLEIQISKSDFTPAQNNILLKPNMDSFGSYTAFDNSSGIGDIASLAKDQVLDKASDAILSKIKTQISGKLANSALGKAVSSLSSKLTSSAIGKTISALGAKIGAALGSFAPIIGNIIGAIVGAIAGWIAQKLLPFLQKIKDGAKKAAKGAIATVAAIIFLPFSIFASSFVATLLITIITLPILVAIIMFIINSGAYVVPAKPSTISAQELISPYIDVTKTANPAGPFKNSELPLEIEYTVEIKAKKSGLTNIQINDNCTVTKKNSSPSCPSISSETKIPTGDEIPKNITTSQSFSFKYKRSYSSPTFEDSLIIDTISVVADVPEQKNVESASSAIIKIGNPPEQCPSGWPISGSYPITQGPGGSFSHSSVQAIDIGTPIGTPVKATHSGIATVVYTSNAYRPLYVDIISTCGGQFTSRYAHLISASVITGQKITKGQTIGYSGSDGTGPHLHYEFRGLLMNTPHIPKSVPANCDHCMSTN